MLFSVLFNKWSSVITELLASFCLLLVCTLHPTLRITLKVIPLVEALFTSYAIFLALSSVFLVELLFLPIFHHVDDLQLVLKEKNAESWVLQFYRCELKIPYTIQGACIVDYLDIN